jgi:hypothetical protein
MYITPDGNRWHSDSVVGKISLTGSGEVHNCLGSVAAPPF